MRVSPNYVSDPHERHKHRGVLFTLPEDFDGPLGRVGVRNVVAEAEESERAAEDDEDGIFGDFRIKHFTRRTQLLATHRSGHGTTTTRLE